MNKKQTAQEAVQETVREELKAALAGIFEGISRKYLETIRPAAEPAEPKKDDSLDALQYAAQQVAAAVEQEEKEIMNSLPLSQRVKLKEQQQQKAQEERRESLGIAKKHNKRWDGEEELALYNIVKAAETAGETIEAAFKRFSAESGRSLGAVRNKYYTKFVKRGRGS